MVLIGGPLDGREVEIYGATIMSVFRGNDRVLYRVSYTYMEIGGEMVGVLTGADLDLWNQKSNGLPLLPTKTIEAGGAIEAGVTYSVMSWKDPEPWQKPKAKAAKRGAAIIDLKVERLIVLPD